MYTEFYDSHQFGDDNGCWTIYKKGAIDKIFVFSPLHADIQTIVVHFRDGKKFEWQTKYIDIYTHQYGLHVSWDGTRVFAQTWEMGLMCFDSRTGERLWKTQSRRGVTSVVVKEDTICCHRHEYSIQLLSIDTGEVLMEKRPANSWGFHILDSTHILCQVTARRWEVIRTTDLAVVDTIPKEQLCQPLIDAFNDISPYRLIAGCDFWGVDFDGNFLHLEPHWIGDPSLLCGHKFPVSISIPYTLKDK